MKETQADKILKVFQDKPGEWINGRYFLHSMYISQYHARIFDLQRAGYQIEASTDTDEYGFKAYRLITQESPLAREFRLEYEQRQKVEVTTKGLF